ncbi:MAG: hypothetical protein P4L44_03220 [Oryzomonas sp.]|uniref:hypothetical protein n=1 Tax=Oryzomonas sp. TaxID=2855186 RepID=UPI00284347AA|nr:hypothetical protein [Oryzomonas sp.]MDR3578956.1 hypothetical protein [Oryzomonas sp.]
MQVEQRGSNEIIVTGNIKTLEDSNKIKDAIGRLVAHGSQNIHLEINDSFSMSSTVIGFLMKLVHHDKVQLSISVVDGRLYTLLDELCMVKIFNVRLVGQRE